MGGSIGRRGLVAGAAASAGLGLMGGPAEARFKQVAAGDPAPKYAVYTFDKRKLTSADLAGKVVVLNYWATWCAPCKAEMVVFDAYLRQHADQRGDLMIFAVATESSLPNKYLQSLSKALSFPLALSVAGKGLGTIGNAVPTSYVIDRAGVVRLAHAGAFTTKSFDALVSPLLAEAAPATA